MVRISYESWRNVGRVVVARDEKGRIRSYRLAKGSDDKESLQRYKSLYSDNKTLYKDRKRLANVVEVLNMQKVSRDREGVVSREPHRNAQYVVSGVVDGVSIQRRSPKLGRLGVDTPEEAREYAYDNFYKEVGRLLGNSYDSNEGMRFATRVTDIKEGWVYYK